MQFGVGILGRGWSAEAQLARVLDNDQPERPKFAAFARGYAAKIAAETVLTESATVPDLTDTGILTLCAQVSLTPRRSEAHMIRTAFLNEYATAMPTKEN